MQIEAFLGLNVLARCVPLLALCFTNGCVANDPAGSLDGGACNLGWHAAKLYTEPGCEPPPARQTVCAPDIVDAACHLVCGCDGEVYCAETWGGSGDRDYGLAHPYSTEDPQLGCMATATPTTSVTPGTTPDSGVDPSIERDSAIEPDAPERDASMSLDTDASRGAGDDAVDASSAASDASTAASAAFDAAGGSAEMSLADSGQGVNSILDASLGECPTGWAWKQLYTEPGCASTSRQWVCAPAVWDAGCLLLCACDGMEYCGAVWGSSDDWAHGLEVPFTQCEVPAQR